MGDIETRIRFRFEDFELKRRLEEQSSNKPLNLSGEPSQCINGERGIMERTQGFFSLGVRHLHRLKPGVDCGTELVFDSFSHGNIPLCLA